MYIYKYLLIWRETPEIFKVGIYKKIIYLRFMLNHFMILNVFNVNFYLGIFWYCILLELKDVILFHGLIKSNYFPG